MITRQELLGRIALDHLLRSDDPANVISLARASKIAQKYWHIDQAEDAERDLIRLAVDTGLVTVQQQGESLQFIHLSICEYLAGKELAERNQRQLRQVLSRVASGAPEARRLWETVTFAIALSKREPREQALRRLTELGAPNELMLHIIRELQSYDLRVFGETVERATRDISARSVQNWDADWLARVRLILSCLGDAHRLAVVRRPANVATVPAWLADLVDSDETRFDRIFGLYLATSPAEALRVAGEFNVRDRLFADRERIVSAMEHPDLIALGMRMIVDRAPDSEVWIDALAEAALRFELVAQMLLEEEIPPSLGVMADAVEKRHAWHRFGPAANTFYGAVLAVATGRVEPLSQRDAPRLVGRVDVVSLVQAAERESVLRKAGLLRPEFIVPLALVAGFGLFLLFLRKASGGEWFLVFASFAPFLGLMLYLSRYSIGETALLSPTGSSSGLLNLGTASGRSRRRGAPDVLATRFSDGVVRLHVGDKERHSVEQIPIAELRWSLLSGWMLCDAEGRRSVPREPMKFIDAVSYRPIVQATNLCRWFDQEWCISVEVRKTVRLLPARRPRHRQSMTNPVTSDKSMTEISRDREQQS